MPSVREERTRTEAGLRKKAAALGGVLALIALVVGSLFGDRGLLYLFAQQERTLALCREILELRDQNGQLALEIRSLRSDPQAIERLAREQLGLSRPGETVFLIRDAE
jgi:cell division protein FtsB